VLKSFTKIHPIWKINSDKGRLLKSKHQAQKPNPPVEIKDYEAYIFFLKENELNKETFEMINDYDGVIQLNGPVRREIKSMIENIERNE